jgi:hypothetical protein
MCSGRKSRQISCNITAHCQYVCITNTTAAPGVASGNFMQTDPCVRRLCLYVIRAIAYDNAPDSQHAVMTLGGLLFRMPCTLAYVDV